MSPAIVFGWLPVIGIITGLARARFPRVPWLASALLVATYLVFVIIAGTYAARCWDCAGGDNQTTRGDGFFVASVFFGVLLVLTLLGIWLGSRLAGTLARLIGAAREVRDGLRSRQGTDA